MGVTGPAPQDKLELDEDEEAETVVLAPPSQQGDAAQQILENLIQTTELFDQKNGEYMVMEQKSEASRKVQYIKTRNSYQTHVYICTYSFVVYWG